MSSSSIPDLTVDDRTDRELLTNKTGILFSTDNEPYLPLASPLERFRLTPPRENDGVVQVQIHNDPGMRRCLVFPPLPFTEQDGLNWVQRNQMRQKVEYARICSFFKSDEEAPSGHEEEEEEEEDRRWLEGSRWFPLMVLRDTSVNGGKDYIGECALLAIGHGVWVIGAIIVPRYRTLGLASSIVQHALQTWITPNPYVVKVIAECFEDNVPSRKTWERAGFVVDEEKTGGIVRRGEEEGGDRKEVVYKYTRGG